MNNKARRILIPIALMGGILVCGCAEPGKDSLLGRHLNNDPRGSAKARWDGVRGDVTLQLAQQHYRAGRLQEAESALSRVLAMTPNNAEVYKFGAHLYIELGQLAKAQEAVAAAARLPGYDAETEYLAGMVAERYGDLERAVNHFKTAQQMQPNVPEYILAAAETYVGLDQADKAFELLNARAKDFDGCGPMSVLAAQVSRMLGKREEAAQYCREALHIATDDDEVLAELAGILAWADCHAEAIGILLPIVEKSVVLLQSAPAGTGVGVSASIRRTLAQSYFAQSKYQDACRILRPVMSDDASDVGAWTLFCRSALLNGDSAGADEAITLFLSRNEPSAETHLLAGYIHLSRRNPDAAAESARKALRLDTGLEPGWLLLAEALRANGLTQKAREACEDALRVIPQSGASSAMLASLEWEDANSPGIASGEPDVTSELNRNVAAGDAEEALP
ncbi:MAG TPA: tetratricopeptide repeat protein [Phycisphaerae bacterium]|nr:tetratricopeptide repeat protein [Phycisphaerae bacterium]